MSYCWPYRVACIMAYVCGLLYDIGVHWLLHVGWVYMMRLCIDGCMLMVVACCIYIDGCMVLAVYCCATVVGCMLLDACVWLYVVG